MCTFEIHTTVTTDVTLFWYCRQATTIWRSLMPSSLA